MNKELIDLLKKGKKLTRKSWKSGTQYIYMEQETLFIYWCVENEQPWIKEANQDNFPYEELFEEDWIVFED